jgi:hypothetical protein
MPSHRRGGEAHVPATRRDEDEMMSEKGRSRPRPARAMERRSRWALLRTWRDLRLSLARGRPITLPNLLRLHRRRLWHAGIDPDALPLHDPAAPVAVLKHYRTCQPVRIGIHPPRPA